MFLIGRAKDGDTPVVRAGGELDLAVAPELKASLHRLIDDGERRLIIDMTEATFIDSTTIGTLLSALKRVREEGGSLEIVCTNRNVLKTFEYAGLERELSFHDSLEDATQPAHSV